MSAIKYFKRASSIIVKILGIFFILLIITAFTDLPFYGRYYLGKYKNEINLVPASIVLLGAGGMPGPENLMRISYCADASSKFPDARIFVAIASWSPSDKYSPAGRIKQELLMRGVDSNKIFFDTLGVNTFEQARNINKKIENNSQAILIVTSPEHNYRAVKVFEKCGFKNVYGYSSFEENIPEELLKNKKSKSGGGGFLDLRYNFWTQLKYQIILLREYTAITYYKLSGKI